MKYIINITIIVFFIFWLNFVFADVVNKEYIEIQSPGAIVIDSESGRILYEKQINEKRPMASLTKLMTSILLVQNCELNEIIEVPKEAVGIGGSQVGLKKGDKVSMKSLLYGMLLPSGNDCAITVAMHIGGTIENFAEMMTNKAKELGAFNTSFANPHGLDNENHYTTPKDMALIAKEALKNKYINEAMNTISTTMNFGSFSKLLNNTNALLRTYDKADGGKTGFTNGANRCLVASATDENSRYIAVILGADTTNIRFFNAKLLLEESFKRYTKTDISDYLNFYINIPVKKGSIKYYERQYSSELSIPLTKEEYENIYIKQYSEPLLVPPLRVGTKVGRIEVLVDDEVLYEKDVFLEENIYKKTVLDYIKQGLSNMFKEVELI
ncbi:MAG: D-alanyl-D-alanine carboxypeptidase family protein [Clostridia bacterium]